MKVQSREYKAMLDHGRFADRAKGVGQFWSELKDAASRADGVAAKGGFDEKDKRTIVFLDTPDLTIGRNDLVFRRRKRGGSVQYTLKCRSDDRYLAAGADVRAAKGFRDDRKLEEDIAPPFRCRYSHSATVTADRGTQLKSLGDAARLFPVLGILRVDGRACPPSTPLEVVHGVTAFERVYTGAAFVFGRGKAQKASVALILWSNGKKGRPLAAEVSFRVRDSDERFGAELARAARTMFEVLQRMDWCRPEGATKTQFVYRGAARG